jgi:threonine dehydratase
MIKIAEAYSAKKRIEHLIRKTPLEYSQTLSDLIGSEVWLKLENYQVTGSFKIRGAANSLLLLNPEQRQKGVVASSAGNHALGLGYIGKKLGIKVKIYLPENTPSVKILALKHIGVELVIEGDEYIEAERNALKDSKYSGRVFVSPYNNWSVIAGQATIGLEMLEDNPELDTIIVPVGGGGLVSGVGSVWKQATNAKIYGVQSIASPVMYESSKVGKIIEIPLQESIAEGLHGGIEPGSITLEICKKCIDEYILVKETSIIDAMKFMLIKQHHILEGAGAVGVAALMEQSTKFKDKKVGVILSGSNIDENLLKILSE